MNSYNSFPSHSQCGLTKNVDHTAPAALGAVAGATKLALRGKVKAVLFADLFFDIVDLLVEGFQIIKQAVKNPYDHADNLFPCTLLISKFEVVTYIINLSLFRFNPLSLECLNGNKTKILQRKGDRGRKRNLLK